MFSNQRKRHHTHSTIGITKPPERVKNVGIDKHNERIGMKTRNSGVMSKEFMNGTSDVENLTKKNQDTTFGSSSASFIVTKTNPKLLVPPYQNEISNDE